MANGYKSGGRAAGTPNRRTQEAAQVVDRLEARLRAEGRLAVGESLDPLERLALTMIDSRADSAQQFAAARELARYLYPHRKAVEFADATQSTPPIATSEAIAQIEEAIDRVVRKRGRGGPNP